MIRFGYKVTDVLVEHVYSHSKLTNVDEADHSHGFRGQGGIS